MGTRHAEYWAPRVGAPADERSQNFSIRGGKESHFLSEYADEYVKKQSLRMKLKKGEKPSWIAGQPFDSKRASFDPHASTRKSSLHRDDFKRFDGVHQTPSIMLENQAAERERIKSGAGTVPFRTTSTYDDHMGTDKGWRPKPGFDRSKNCNTRDNFDPNRPVEVCMRTTLKDEFPDWKLPKPEKRNGNPSNNKLQTKFTETSLYRSDFTNDNYPRPELVKAKHQPPEPGHPQFFNTTYRDDYTRKLAEARERAMAAREAEKNLAQRIEQMTLARQTWGATSPATKPPPPGTKGQSGTTVAWAGRKRRYVVHEPRKAPFSSADDQLPFFQDTTYRDFCAHARPNPRQPYVQPRTRATCDTLTGPDHFTR